MGLQLQNVEEVGYVYTDVIGMVEISVEGGLLLNLDKVVVDDYRVLVGEDDKGNPCIALVLDGASTEFVPNMHLDGDPSNYVFSSDIHCGLNTDIDYDNGLHMTLTEDGCEFGSYDANVVEIYITKNEDGQIDGFLFQFI